MVYTLNYDQKFRDSIFTISDEISLEDEPIPDEISRND